MPAAKTDLATRLKDRNGAGPTSEVLLVDARGFLLAAEHLLNLPETPLLPAYFLFGRSIELSLKSFLLGTGFAVANLKKRDFGHNLGALLNESIARGLEKQVDFSAQERGMIELLGDEYESTRLSYRDTNGMYCLPPISAIEDLTRRIISRLVHSSNTLQRPNSDA